MRQRVRRTRAAYLANVVGRDLGRVRSDGGRTSTIRHAAAIVVSMRGSMLRGSCLLELESVTFLGSATAITSR